MTVMATITIRLDNEHRPQDTIRYVAALVEDGNTRGHDPLWSIED
jgi:hypothetical protein